MLLSVIWILSTLPTLPLTFPLLFQSAEWLAGPPASCILIIDYFCIMLYLLSRMFLSYLLPFTSLTYNCPSKFSPSRSILWLNLKFLFEFHLQTVHSLWAGMQSYLSSYLHKKNPINTAKWEMNKGLLATWQLLKWDRCWHLHFACKETES